MAKKAATSKSGTRSTATRSTPSASKQSTSSRAMSSGMADSDDTDSRSNTASFGSRSRANTSSAKSTIMEWVENPAVRYVASGIATAVLAKIATNMSSKYPQISTFLRENLETLEGKLGEYKTGTSTDSVEARQ